MENTGMQGHCALGPCDVESIPQSTSGKGLGYGPKKLQCGTHRNSYPSARGHVFCLSVSSKNPIANSISTYRREGDETARDTRDTAHEDERTVYCVALRSSLCLRSPAST